MHPAFQHPMLRGMDEGSRLFWIMHAFPALQWILLIVEPVVVNLSTKAKVALAFRSYLAAQINKLLKDPELLDSVEHETVYHHLMQPGRSQSHIPSRKSLLEEVRMPPTSRINDANASFCTVCNSHVCGL